MDVYEKMLEFKKKYPMTVSWRLKEHAKIVEKHLNPNEEVIYAFAAQKNDNPFDIITTFAVVLTNKRLWVNPDDELKSSINKAFKNKVELSVRNLGK